MSDVTKEQRAEVLTELRRRTHDGDTISELARALIYESEAEVERVRKELWSLADVSRDFIERAILQLGRARWEKAENERDEAQRAMRGIREAAVADSIRLTQERDEARELAGEKRNEAASYGGFAGEVLPWETESDDG